MKRERFVYQCKGCYGQCIQVITQEPYEGPIERCGISGDVAKWERAPKNIERQFTSANTASHEICPHFTSIKVQVSSNNFQVIPGCGVSGKLQAGA
jgi:hypothetical protein